MPLRKNEKMDRKQMADVIVERLTLDPEALRRAYVNSARLGHFTVDNLLPAEGRVRSISDRADFRHRAPDSAIAETGSRWSAGYSQICRVNK